MKKTAVYIETYGCQMNELDSELVFDLLARHDFIKAARLEDAAVVLLNTCSVRALAEQKVWSRLGRIERLRRATHRELIIGVIGCMAEREGAAIPSRAPYVDIVCGPSRLSELPALILRAGRVRQSQVAVSGHARRGKTAVSVGKNDLDRHRRPAGGKAQAFVRITHGCDKFCSYCVVPYVRGPEQHRPPGDILDEARRLVDAGARELTLIGQTVNHYRATEDGRVVSFADLLWRLHESLPSLPRICFVTSYARDFGDDILQVMARAPRIDRYLHLPAQSGSNRVLRLMNRGYTVEEYLDLIDRARAQLPEVRFASDMIVGFPTETEEEHEDSLTLLRRVRYDNLFVFKYSPRSGTVAARRFEDDVPEATKKRRNQEMLTLQAELSLRA